MRVKRYPISVWFLDDDLEVSASFLTTKDLEKSIVGCTQALISTKMYTLGIRSKKFYTHYFSKDNKEYTLNTMFDGWSYNKVPSFSQYTSKHSKWCRQCKEHFDYILQYLGILHEEYKLRTTKNHKHYPIYDWILNRMEIKLPYANIKKIVLPWKVINPKYRRINIVEGYKLQYSSSFDDGTDLYNKYNESNIDIPDFLVKKFNLFS